MNVVYMNRPSETYTSITQTVKNEIFQSGANLATEDKFILCAFVGIIILSAWLGIALSNSDNV